MSKTSGCAPSTVTLPAKILVQSLGSLAKYPRSCRSAPWSRQEQYLSGIAEDHPGHPLLTVNFEPVPGATDGAVMPLRLPN